ncbi:TRAP transporter substrate-binding protein [Martelella alba]|uniref:TRAP transporter substrate-binding protein n=1 Tax=Martelella alba TaxID=2590451 RepID=A0A506UG97_9HYPH|nr:TRAP transporter substrate-binding protein [Martelella alba]TPW32275.1 TRAP transporter substrate-binding protein [Martelella alba]
MKNTTYALVALAAGIALSSTAANAAVRLKLADALAADHPTSVILQQFADEVEEKTDGEVKIRLYMNAVLGSEREVLEQVQNGAVDITRVSAANLENFNPVYQAFTLPYLFSDQEHFYKVMDGPIIDPVYDASIESGFKGLTYFDSGARSFYTKSKCVETPDDLIGQKLRVINSHTSIRMVELMGGIPTPLPYGEIYTALQQGVIDGAENNPTALTLGRHGEVVKCYSLDEHLRIPDFLVISNSALEKLTDEQKAIIKEAAVHATAAQKQVWNEAVDEAMQQIADMGVQIVHPDKAPFQEKVAPLIEEYKANPAIGQLVDAIQNAQ